MELEEHFMGNKIIFKSIDFALKKFHNLISRLDNYNKCEFYKEIYTEILIQLYNDIKFHTENNEPYFIENFNWEFAPYVYDHNLFSSLNNQEQLDVKLLFDNYLLKDSSHYQIECNDNFISFYTQTNPILIIETLLMHHVDNKIIHVIVNTYSGINRGSKFKYEFNTGNVTISK